MKLLGLGESLIPEAVKPMLTSIGLLLLRVFLGATMLIAHGIPKLGKFSTIPPKFADPIGVGKTLSLVLAVSAEVGCAFLLVIGLFTRFAAFPLLFTMLVAAFVIHGGDPWHKKEFALLYGVPFLMLIFTGAGRYSLDAYFSKKK